MVEFLGKATNEIKQEFERVFNAIQQKFLLPKNIKVNVNFVSETKIKKLNKSTRNIDKVTDVLTYPYINLKVGQKLKVQDYVMDIDPEDNTLTIGDIYICSAVATRQAEEYKHSFKREMCFLFCHGMLHILGYDHIEKADETLMIEMQKNILTELGITREDFRCGFVTIVGKTNVGKSTLINRLVGQHVAIVSPKSQTTRENIIGVYNDKNTQIVFVDTPGYHKRANKIDDEMDKNIAIANQDTEIVLMLISAKQSLQEQFDEMLKKVNTDAYKILVINKVDETTYEKLYPQLAKLDVKQADEIIPISAQKGTNCDKLLEIIKQHLPTFNYEMRYFPIDEYTDKTVRQMVAELVREKALYLLDDEIPHGIQVVVNEYKENETPIQICADIYCERDSHKAIILGKGGAMIKEISTKARMSIEKFVGKPVRLELYVKVKQGWRNDIKAITEFGLNAGE